jgi:hypothetical protein
MESICSIREISDLNIRRAARRVISNLCNKSEFYLRERIERGT